MCARGNTESNPGNMWSRDYILEFESRHWTRDVRYICSIHTNYSRLHMKLPTAANSFLASSEQIVSKGYYSAESQKQPHFQVNCIPFLVIF